MSSIWFRPYTLEEFARLQAGTLADHMGIAINEIGDDYLRGTMPVDARTWQPFRMLHGGASVVLAETLGSIAALMTVDTDKLHCVGQEINANHLRGISDGLVTGTARPFHIGGSSQVWGIEIRDPQNRLVCVSRLTVAVRPKAPR